MTILSHAVAHRSCGGDAANDSILELTDGSGSSPAI